MNLCRFSDMLGKPGEGVHSFRIFDIAVVDVILTFVGAFFIYFIIKTVLKIGGINVNYWLYIIILFLLFILGIILHRLFCVKTTVDKFLFGE